MERKRKNKGGYSGILQLAADESNWPTPIASDALKATLRASSIRKHAAGPKGARASGIHKLAALESNWPTPLASQAHHARFATAQIAADVAKKRQPDAKWKMADGVYSHSTEVAAVEFGERLNPLLALWLMGFPPNWLSGVLAETPSSRPSQSTSQDASSHSTQGKQTRRTGTRRTATH
ncbi:MAG: hypothetical protein WCE53_04670 [Candidatus Acidiferrum sp.]